MEGVCTMNLMFAVYPIGPCAGSVLPDVVQEVLGQIEDLMISCVPLESDTTKPSVKVLRNCSKLCPCIAMILWGHARYVLSS